MAQASRDGATSASLETRGTPDVRAGMRDAVVDTAAPAETGERFVQLVAEVCVRHRQLRGTRLRLPGRLYGLQPRRHSICSRQSC